jgi:hypothetical protein
LDLSEGDVRIVPPPASAKHTAALAVPVMD